RAIAGLPRGARLRLALQELGPIFVKFGQILSTRRDLVPPDVASELTLLQDRVAPFDGDAARAIVEQALGRPVAEAFDRFDTTPLESATRPRARSWSRCCARASAVASTKTCACCATSRGWSTAPIRPPTRSARA